MVNREDIIKSVLYFSFVVIGELVLHFSTSYFSATNKYTMPIIVAVFFVIAWLLKTNLKTLLLAACMLALYGCLAFYLGYNAYAPDFPCTIGEFLPTVLVKTLVYTFPIALVSVITFKK